jgi:hypothetical protein
VSFADITLCGASQRVIPKVSVYFVIDSVRKLLDTPSYGGEYVKLHKSIISGLYGRVYINVSDVLPLGEDPMFSVDVRFGGPYGQSAYDAGRHPAPARNQTQLSSL